MSSPELARQPHAKRGKAAAPAPGKRRGRVDWEAVERDYRTGKYTKVELSKLHDFNPSTLSRKVKEDQALDPTRWQEDLTEVVRQATNALLMADLVKSEVKEGQEQVKAAVQVAAAVNVQVIRQHQYDAGATRALMMAMLAELTLATHKPGEIERLAEIMTEGQEANADDVAEARSAIKDMLDIHKRVGSIQKLADTLSKLQPLERRAFGIKDEDGDKPPAAGRPLAAIPTEELRAALRGEG